MQSIIAIGDIVEFILGGEDLYGTVTDILPDDRGITLEDQLVIEAFPRTQGGVAAGERIVVPRLRCALIERALPKNAIWV